MKIGILTLAAVQAQDGKKSKTRDYYEIVDFGDGEGYSTCTDFFSANNTFTAFQEEDGFRIGFFADCLRYRLYRSVYTV